MGAPRWIDDAKGKGKPAFYKQIIIEPNETRLTGIGSVDVVKASQIGLDRRTLALRD